MDNQKIPATEVCVLAAGSAVEGNVKVSANLRLEGEIKGDVACNGRLVLAKSALIHGNVVCSDLISEGKIFGNVVAKTAVQLAATAVLNGDIQCTQLQIDNGAYFSGKCTMPKKEH